MIRNPAKKLVWKAKLPPTISDKPALFTKIITHRSFHWSGAVRSWFWIFFIRGSASWHERWVSHWTRGSWRIIWGLLSLIGVWSAQTCTHINTNITDMKQVTIENSENFISSCHLFSQTLTTPSSCLEMLWAVCNKDKFEFHLFYLRNNWKGFQEINFWPV